MFSLRFLLFVFLGTLLIASSAPSASAGLMKNQIEQPSISVNKECLLADMASHDSGEPPVELVQAEGSAMTGNSRTTTSNNVMVTLGAVLSWMLSPQPTSTLSPQASCDAPNRLPMELLKVPILF